MHILRNAMLCSLVVCMTLPAAAAVHTVEQGESISATLRNVAPGDIVRLVGTEYRENIVIDVPVTLVGVNLPVIRGGYQGNVVHVLAPGTEIRGVHVSEASPLLTKDMACILIEADDATVRESVVTESLHGIYVKGANRAVIVNNRIEGRLDLIEADRGNGIHLWNSNGNRVADNEILNVRDGIYFSFANETEVARNHVHDVRYGLHYMYSHDNAFYDNLFEHNVAGAALMYSERILFSRNTFARCRGYRAYGILLQSMEDVTATSNLILDNSRGIFLNNAKGNVFEANDVVDNDLAIQLNGGCDDNIFSGNNFLDNLSELLLDVSDRETRWADEESGNYWSRYRGYDLDKNGVGDVAFGVQNIFQVMESKVPEVRFYLLSPASEVLRAAERALPILNLGDVEDPLPLMRAADNHQVPWEVAGDFNGGPSPLWAAVYIIGAGLPLGALVYLSRPRPRRASGKEST
ncbi:MAG: nitrous oxide reductase family maturation protein NosD [Acidobacteria bacterium]|nr:nitrous oxide reductase family maturation protein NosD [Acidobacteriota bacterium]NIM62506.1 nitrous oxide reductase family maturation protein NosD [Acidobacteriota bacterium]NIO60577.1 nitrous oxide reductase family maturation protein NosD [Acidobacteriota bacterium]NIQ29312.1 nitrous oxide reductase family maturation protein NosD [Acidobacteriota bacterium]NIQ83912.1 nitrous oxide reductase family maturation protein NosD [Acidobacteriota bacterium]